MKDPFHSDRGFNTPAEMMARATFVAMLVAFAAGILLTIAGLLAAEVRLSMAGAAALALAWAGRARLKRRGEYEPSDRALEALAHRGPPPDEARANALLALLEQWEAMEQKRGTPGFDPWALQALRNEIRAAVAGDPALERLFSDLQRAA